MSRPSKTEPKSKSKGKGRAKAKAKAVAVEAAPEVVVDASDSESSTGRAKKKSVPKRKPRAVEKAAEKATEKPRPRPKPAFRGRKGRRTLEDDVPGGTPAESSDAGDVTAPLDTSPASPASPMETDVPLQEPGQPEDTIPTPGARRSARLSPTKTRARSAKRKEASAANPPQPLRRSKRLRVDEGEDPPASEEPIENN